jgi:GntR family transcriptional regulator/MocR family aminotransferase
LQDQIYRSIRQSILDGFVRGDRRLPSTRALAADLGVSRTTVLLALEQLRAEGYVVARRGSGMFVAPRLPARLPPGSATGGHSFRNFRSHVHSFRGAGAALARMRPPDRRPRSSVASAFRLGTPALDLFPQRLWAQLTRECLRALKPSHLDYSQLAGLRQLRVAIAEAGAVARHALRRRSDPGRHGGATRPRSDRTHVARSR